MKKLILILTVMLIGCTSETDATKALESAGFSDIKMTGYNWFACSQDDWYHSGFTAKNAKGKDVEGTVCSGLFFKNSTIRFD